MRPIIEGIISAIGYPGIFLIMLVENLFPPIPSEFVMPFAGFVAGRGDMNIGFVILAGTLGSVVGAVALYYVGLYAGEPLLRAFLRRWGRVWMLSEQDLDRSLEFFTRRGSTMVLVGRCIPIVRSLISIPAGMARMNMIQFLILTTIGAAAWTSLLAVAGLLLGANWEDVLLWLKQYERIVLVVLALIVAVGGWRWFVTRRGQLAARDARSSAAPGA